MGRGALRDELMTLLVAGQETSAILLAWACAYLAHHPAKQERAASEALQVRLACVLFVVSCSVEGTESRQPCACAPASQTMPSTIPHGPVDLKGRRACTGWEQLSRRS